MASLVTGADPQSLLLSDANPRGNAFDIISGQASGNQPTIEDFESIWGPTARDIRQDPDRFRRTSRKHLSQLPPELQGQQLYINDRVDGLITNATGSPFTTLILPYHYCDAPDSKIKWNVWSYDEGLASRVPYEAAARTLTESQERFQTQLKRDGLAITMEHNFMMSEQGRKNFYYRLMQVVGSIQKTNDLYVIMALVNARSYFRKVREKFYRDSHSLEDEIRDYVNTFGFLQKNVNGLDILIEDAKQLLRGWGGSEPNFLLINSRLTFQLQMSPERTSYVTQGSDGKRRLEEGPNLSSYRGIRIIHSHQFPLQDGEAPRDLLRRRVRVAEFYLIPNCSNAAFNSEESVSGIEDAAPASNMLRGHVGENDIPPPGPAAPRLDAAPGSARGDACGQVRLYDESSDSFVCIGYEKLLEQCRRFISRSRKTASDRNSDDPLAGVLLPDAVGSVLLLRPNIEHYMFGMIMGKGGSIDDLGATLWGQTELSCFDDAQHGVWGMSYKYHSLAVVFNERNLYRMWDIAYDGYAGGKDATMLDWGSDNDIARFIKSDSNLTTPYTGPSVIVIPIPTQVHTLPSPLPIANLANTMLMGKAHSLATADLFVEDMFSFLDRVAEKIGDEHIHGIRNSISFAYDQLHMHRNSAAAKCACLASIENEATLVRLAYGGTYHYKLQSESSWVEMYGCGHHGPDAVGKASERAGRGFRISAPPQPIRIV